MARPESNTVSYFPFYCDEGKKMHYLEETYGNDGFATFVKILRELAKTNNHYLDLSKNTTSMFLAAKCKIPKSTLELIIQDLVELDKFDRVLWEENKIIWCQDFIDSVQDAYIKRKSKCMNYHSLLLLLESFGVRKPSKLPLEVVNNTQRKEEERKEEKKKEKEKHALIFVDLLETIQIEENEIEKLKEELGSRYDRAVEKLSGWLVTKNKTSKGIKSFRGYLSNWLLTAVKEEESKTLNLVPSINYKPLSNQTNGYARSTDYNAEKLGEWKRFGFVFPISFIYNLDPMEYASCKGNVAKFLDLKYAFLKNKIEKRGWDWNEYENKLKEEYKDYDKRQL